MAKPSYPSTTNLSNTALGQYVVADYLFNEGSGTVAHDSANAAKTMTATSPTWVTSGVSGFDSTAGGFSIASPAASYMQLNQPYSLEMRLRINGSGTFKPFYSGSGGSQSGFYFYYGQISYTAFSAYANGGPTYGYIGDTAEHHIVATKSSTGLISFYLDGTLVSTSNVGTGATPYDSGAGWTVAGTNSPPCVVTLCRVYNTNLTATQVTALAADSYPTSLYASAAATDFSLVAPSPSQGLLSAASQSFTITPVGGPFTGSIALNDKIVSVGGAIDANGVFKDSTGTTITSLSFSSATAQTFTYTPSSSLSSPPQNITITATASGGITTSHTAVYQAFVAVGITLTPSSQADSDGQSVTLSPGITGGISGHSTAVTLSVSGGGTISATAGGSVITSGVSGTPFYFNAPGSGSGTATVTAISVADNTKTVTAAITYSPTEGISAISPSNTTVNAASVTNFAASMLFVPGGDATNITWACSPSSGAINASTGVFTAPANLTGSGVVQTITATGHDTTNATNYSTTTLIIIRNITVSVSPASVSLTYSASQQFTATVIGSSDQSGTWSVTGGGSNGTITSGGLYTAPAATLTASVIFVPSANTGISATATVSVNNVATVRRSVNLGSSNSGLTQLVYELYDDTGAAVGSAVTITVTELAVGSFLASGNYSVPVTGTPGTHYVIAYTKVDGSLPVSEDFTFPGGTISGNVTIGAVAAGVVSPASFFANQPAPTVSGNVTVGAVSAGVVAPASFYNNQPAATMSGNVTIGGYATGKSPAEQILGSTSATPLVTDSAGKVGLNATETLTLSTGAINSILNTGNCFLGLNVQSSTISKSYIGCVLKLISGAGAGQVRYINDYSAVGSLHKAFYNSPFQVSPAVGDTYVIQNASGAVLDSNYQVLISNPLPAIDSTGNVFVANTNNSGGGNVSVPNDASIQSDVILALNTVVPSVITLGSFYDYARKSLHNLPSTETSNGLSGTSKIVTTRYYAPGTVITNNTAPGGAVVLFTAATGYMADGITVAAVAYS